MSFTLSEDLRAVRSWLDEGRGWLKGASECPKGKMCLSRAIEKVTSSGARQLAVTNAVHRELAARGVPYTGGIPSWNDAKERTWADVDAVLGECIRVAEDGP